MPETTEVATVTAPQMAADINQAVATARQYPRSVERCVSEMCAMAALDLETAEACWYTLPRDGKSVSDMSIRLAEIAAAAWGNIRYGARSATIGDRFLEAEGVAMDLEKNVTYTATVKRSIMSSKGNRYSDNMIQVTMMAAQSIAVRNAIFKVIPKAYVKKALEAAHQKVLSEVGDYKEALPKMVDAFSDKGVTAEMLVKYFRLDGRDTKEAIANMTAANFVDARGIYNALKDGEFEPADFFKIKRPSTVTNPFPEANDG